MFHRVPIHLVEELLDCFDILHAARLYRISRGWKAALLKVPIRNQKTVVLQHLSVDDMSDITLRMLGETLGNVKSWEKDSFLLEPKSINHFIFITNFSDLVLWIEESKNGWSFISTSLNKITFCEDQIEWYIAGICSQQLYYEVPEMVDCINFVNCTFRDDGCRVALSAEDEFVIAAFSARQPYYAANGYPHMCPPDDFGIEWNVFAPRLTINRFADSSRKDDIFVWSDSEAARQRELYKDHNRFHSDFCMCKRLDDKNLLWPYPEQQLQWLMETLEGLERTVLQSVKNTDKQWRLRRTTNEHVCKHVFRKLDLTTKATCDGRKLETIDLAFLGRLLVCMNKAKPIPGFQPPPFKFPDDFKYERLDQ